MNPPKSTSSTLLGLASALLLAIGLSSLSQMLDPVARKATPAESSAVAGDANGSCTPCWVPRA